ncbi:MAG TPA: SAM-dependent methyltransferase [Pseudonocardiaceae bacterium]|nr:SAM-dependent methyltransferase [Pseudonocardiaceae bacterium]
MEKRPDWVPEGVEITVPNAARMYDYALGGYHNFAVDREVVAQMEQVAPGAAAIGRANRAYVGRVVRWLVDAGIRQFLDIGSGIPTLGNVHEVAQEAAPDARVMYVDIDPVAVAHSEVILAGNPSAAVIEGDVRRPADILYHEAVTGLIDFAEPVAVLLNAVLHFVSDADDPAGIVARIREPLVSGSYVSITHGRAVEDMPEEAEDVQRTYRRTPTSLHLRRAADLAAMLAGMELVEPGIVPVTEWHPDPSDPEEQDDDDVPLPAVIGVLARQR